VRMESGFGQQPRLGSTTSVNAQDGDPPATGRFRHLTSADDTLVDPLLRDQEGL
jgi:hypothetical protein